jgi:pimeloyl-ACP methyl ester carboxylesterase
MAEFVLVHSAWFGGWCWRRLSSLLEARGHAVHTPTLTGLGERAHLAHPGVDLQTHVDDVVNVLTYRDLRAVVLLGHSSGGAVITGVADRVPERIAHVIYLDAFVPENGQCLVDLIPADRRPGMEALVETEGLGWLLPRFAAPPWEQFLPQAWQVTDEEDLAWVLARLRPTPFGFFTRATQCGNPAAERLRRTYIRCSRWPNPLFDRYATLAAERRGWQLRTIDSSHLPYITDAPGLASLLLELLEAELGAAGCSLTRNGRARIGSRRGLRVSVG